MQNFVQLLIPAFNEAENLPHLFADLVPALQALQRPWHLLIVDDGSQDQTVAVAQALGRDLPVEVYSHRRNLGPGAAFVSGFKQLLPRVADDCPIVTLEADGTSDLAILPTLLAHFDAGADLVLASVYHPEGGLLHTPLSRRLLSAGANQLLRALFKLQDLHTFSSFYRVYRAGVLRTAMSHYGLRLIEEPGFAAVVELLIRVQRLGIRIDEVPMVLDSTRRIGASRMRVGRTMRAYLRMMLRQRLELTPVEELVALDE